MILGIGLSFRSHKFPSRQGRRRVWQSPWNWASRRDLKSAGKLVRPAPKTSWRDDTQLRNEAQTCTSLAKCRESRGLRSVCWNFRRSIRFPLGLMTCTATSNRQAKPWKYDGRTEAILEYSTAPRKGQLQPNLQYFLSCWTHHPFAPSGCWARFRGHGASSQWHWYRKEKNTPPIPRRCPML